MTHDMSFHLLKIDSITYVHMCWGIHGGQMTSDPLHRVAGGCDCPVLDAEN